MGIAYVALYRSSNDANDLNFLKLVYLLGQAVAVAAARRGIVDTDNPSTATVRSPASENVVGWWVCVFPFSIHFSWLCAASLVNINIACVQLGAGTSAQYGMAITSLVVLGIGA